MHLGRFPGVTRLLIFTTPSPCPGSDPREMITLSKRLVVPFVFSSLIAVEAVAYARAADRWDPARQTGTSEYVPAFVGIDAGLPHPTVTATLQTRDGYLWVGTQGGLARFDGVRFTTYQPSNTPAFASGSVRCLFQDKSGDLWAGMESGVVRFRHGAFEVMGLRDTTVSAIAQDDDGTMWIGTLGRGLHSLRDGRWRHHAETPLPSTLSVRCILADSEKRIWVGFNQAGAIYRRESGRFQRFDADGMLRGFDLNRLCEWPRGTFWIGGYQGGLVRLRSAEIARVDGFIGGLINDLQPARDGGLWIVAGNVQKLLDLDRLVLDPRLPKVEADVTALSEDREGNVWLSTKADGLGQFRPLPYQVISSRNGLPSNAVKSVTQDRAGNIWLAAQRGGVSKVAPDGIVHVISGNGMPNEASLVHATKDGAVWFSSAHLLRLREGVLTSFADVRTIHGLFEDQRARLWIGSGRGVLRYEHGEFTKIELMPGRPILYGSSFAEAADGTVYIGSWNLGLFRVNAGGTSAIDVGGALPTKTVRSLLVDREGRVWVGMKGKGIALLHNGQWLNPESLTDAVGGHVFAIAEDSRGYLWLGTALGVMRAPKHNVVALALGERTIRDVRLAGVNSGFHLAPSWPGGQPNVWPLADGRILFASVRGVLAIDPEHLPTNHLPPPVRIERVLLDQTSARIEQNLVAPAGTKGITLDYTALSFVHPQRVSFKYRLEGYDEDWIDAAAQRSVTYRGLGAGRYIFRVKARNNDGVWNDSGATLAFTVAPFFWQTWWFRIIAVAIFTATVVATVRYASFRRLRLKLRELERQAALHRERARIARDIHDDVGNRLTEISLLSGLAMRETTASNPNRDYARKISSTVRQATDSLDEIVWAVSPRNDTLPSVVHYIGEFAVEFLQTAGIRCNVEVPEQIPNRTVPAEIRHNLFLAVKEAFNNAVRHSRASEICLRVAATDDSLLMTICDNGGGFIVPRDTAGADGLRNMQQRMEEIGGTFDLQSQPGSGTRVAFTYHWNDAKPPHDHASQRASS